MPGRKAGISCVLFGSRCTPIFRVPLTFSSNSSSSRVSAGSGEIFHNLPTLVRSLISSTDEMPTRRSRTEFWVPC